jgi:MOSC domain-containing protein YiiM
VSPDALKLVSVNVAQPRVLLERPTGDVISAIEKQPVQQAELELTTLNLEGDRQADTRATAAGGQVHGGPHQAVYAFPVEHYQRLAELLCRPLSPGFMGENLTVEGVTEEHVYIGDTWRWGPALLEVSAPRGPCYKLGIRMGRQAMRTAVREERLVGWYLRVLQPGRVPTTGVLRREACGEGGVSVAEVQRALNDRANVYPELAAVPALSPSIRRALSLRNRDLSGGIPEED